MAESLMQMYETMTATAQQELYDFALFLLSKEKSIKNIEKSASEKFFEIASKIHGNSEGKKWTREEFYER